MALINTQHPWNPPSVPTTIGLPPTLSSNNIESTLSGMMNFSDFENKHTGENKDDLDTKTNASTTQPDSFNFNAPFTSTSPTNITLGQQLQVPQQPSTMQFPQMQNFLPTSTTSMPPYNYTSEPPPPRVNFSNNPLVTGNGLINNNISQPSFNFNPNIAPMPQFSVLTNSMSTWLMNIGLGEYNTILQFHGYDLELIKFAGFTEQDLDAMGIVKRAHRKKLLAKYKIQQ